MKSVNQIKNLMVLKKALKDFEDNSEEQVNLMLNVKEKK